MTTTASEPELTDLPEGLTDLERRIVGEIDTEMESLRETFSEPLAQFERLSITRQNLLAGENGIAVTTSPQTGGSGRSRGRGGSSSGKNRKDEFVRIVTENPGISVADVAAKMNTGANYLYRVRDNAEKEGLIYKEGQQHFPGKRPSGTGRAKAGQAA